MLESYKAACAAVTNAQKFSEQTYDIDCTQARRSAKQRFKDLSDGFVMLVEKTNEYVATGIADVEEWMPTPPIEIHHLGWGRYGFKWDSYFRSLARDMKRKYVQVFTYGKYRYVRSPEGRYEHTKQFTVDLRFPRQKKLEPLAASLLLAADDGPDTKCRHIVESPQIFNFTLFSEAEDHFVSPLYSAWREQCRTNPEFRAVLGLS